MWTTAEPIRRIFRDAFTAVGLPAFNPHSFRKTLVRLGQQVCKTPEEWKAWSQNLGHESESTTFVGYGEVPAHRQAEIMAGIGKPSATALPPDLDLDALRAFLKSAEKSAA
jgi:integrase/recombinase XerD